MRDQNQSISKPLNRRQLAKARTRQKVLDAGRDLFKIGGYDKAVIRDIAKKAGMSTGAVFANFDDKADLLLAIVEVELEDHGALLRQASAEEGAILDRIVRVCTADYTFFSDRLHLLEALAVLETDASNMKNQRARDLTGRRREGLWRIIETMLQESRCGNALEAKVIGECIMSIHFDRCRYQAIKNCKTESYRHGLKELLSHVLAASAIALAA